MARSVQVLSCNSARSWLESAIIMNEELLAKCACAHCGGHIAFPVEAANVHVNCPHCGQLTQLTLEAPPPPSEKPTAAELLAAFTGTVPRTRVSLFYQAGLVLVTVMMIVLPLVYLAMIAAAGWGVWSYATHCSGLLSLGHGGARVYLAKLVVYFAPLFAGVVLVFFMIKPLFARLPPSAQPLAMNPALEPTLYAFIAKICDLVGAPMPRRIDLDCQLNAAASFRRGLRSLFSNDLVLTIGLPLVAGLSLREFAGVVAHEFGHFTQGFGMRLSYVIRTINGWFARVVYQRDAWDVTLDQWGTEAEDWRILIIVNLARLGVGFSRLLLKLLMFLGHGVSCFLLRQMEYDADSYEIKLGGSASFESTVGRLAILGEGLGNAYKNMRTSWNVNRKLPDDLPAYLLVHCSKLPPAHCQRVLDTLGMETTGVFDTHPSNGDRIRRARQAGQPGVFQLDAPASILFTRFDVVSRQVTQLHYNDDLGIGCDSSNLRPVEADATPAAGAAGA